MVEQPAAQGGLHPGHRAVRGEFGEPGDECAPGGGEGQQEQWAGQRVQAVPPLERSDDDLGDQARLRDHQDRARPAEDH